MVEHALPALYALFLWWFSTGLILHLDGLRPGTFRWSMAGATALLAAGLVGLAAGAGDASVAGAFLAFTCALLVWGWVEMGFLTGWITGPRREACPPGAAGWPRLRAAAAAVLWHELAILALAAAVLALTWGRANQVGAWTFLVLWGMRTSAKLNLFLGVRNTGEAFLPDHLRYLASHFGRRPMNPLLPVSVAASALVCALIFARAFAPGAAAGEAAGYTLVGALMALAVLEHLFLALPVPVEALWRWGLRSRQGGRAAAVATTRTGAAAAAAARPQHAS
jgi:putative photosynthetic complex assembly protein 2